MFGLYEKLLWEKKQNVSTQETAANNSKSNKI